MPCSVWIVFKKRPIEGTHVCSVSPDHHPPLELGVPQNQLMTHIATRSAAISIFFPPFQLDTIDA